jgi:hypothetical protein
MRLMGCGGKDGLIMSICTSRYPIGQFIDFKYDPALWCLCCRVNVVVRLYFERGEGEDNPFLRVLRFSISH